DLEGGVAEVRRRRYWRDCVGQLFDLQRERVGVVVRAIDGDVPGAVGQLDPGHVAAVRPLEQHQRHGNLAADEICRCGRVLVTGRLQVDAADTAGGSGGVHGQCERRRLLPVFRHSRGDREVAGLEGGVSGHLEVDRREVGAVEGVARNVGQVEPRQRPRPGGSIGWNGRRDFAEHVVVIAVFVGAAGRQPILLDDLKALGYRRTVWSAEVEGAAGQSGFHVGDVEEEGHRGGAGAGVYRVGLIEVEAKLVVRRRVAVYQVGGGI